MARIGFSMKLVVNGERREFTESVTVEDLLNKLDLLQKPVAVELNRKVIPKVKFSDVHLQEGDKLEIVHFVGGG